MDNFQKSQLSYHMSIHRLAYEVIQKAHRDQMYGDKPYIYHLEAVDSILATYEGVTSYFIRTVGLLHDVLEDTECTVDDLKDLGFPDNVIELVLLVTDEEAPTRKERKRLTNHKLSMVRDSEYELALIVKAADRLANVRHCSRGGNKYLTMYKKEHAEFKIAVYREGLCDKIWEELDDLLK